MVDKRTMHEPSSPRADAGALYPGLTPKNQAEGRGQDGAARGHGAIDSRYCGALTAKHPRSIVEEARAAAIRAGWPIILVLQSTTARSNSFLTRPPNIRGVRTDEWAYMHYPHGDGKPGSAQGGALPSAERSGAGTQSDRRSEACCQELAELRQELPRLIPRPPRAWWRIACHWTKESSRRCQT